MELNEFAVYEIKSMVVGSAFVNTPYPHLPGRGDGFYFTRKSGPIVYAVVSESIPKTTRLRRSCLLLFDLRLYMDEQEAMTMHANKIKANFFKIKILSVFKI